MTVTISTNNDVSMAPQKTETESMPQNFSETSQHADVKLTKVLFTREDASQILLLGKGRGKCVALWEQAEGIDPFRILATKNSDVDPNDACKFPENRVCIGYADGSLAIFNTDKEDLALMSRIPSVHSGCATRALCRHGDRVLSASSNGSLSEIDLETGKSRKIFSGQAGIRSICTTFGESVVMAGDSNGQITIWDLREVTDPIAAQKIPDPIKTIIPSKKALDAVTAMTSHPAQSNLIACGTDDGIVGLIDARNTRNALLTSTYLIARKGITQVQFHPTCADSLLVSANDGSLVRIDASNVPIAAGAPRSMKDTIWLEGDLVNNLRSETIRDDGIYPINSFDIHEDTVVATSSIGMVSLFQQLNFFPIAKGGRF
uniref:WD_REPEATS_REGION domain-containing protein n=1 Tax=Caenorhabditis tropicalis TaxID=1561998 RepID=A0A1I7UTU6_9PELO